MIDINSARCPTAELEGEDIGRVEYIVSICSQV